MKTAQSWRVVQRPKGMASRYTVVVVDSHGLPHLPLTIFYHEIQLCLADGTARTYLHTLLPFFEYLASDAWGCIPSYGECTIEKRAKTIL